MKYKQFVKNKKIVDKIKETLEKKIMQKKGFEVNYEEY